MAGPRDGRPIYTNWESTEREVRAIPRRFISNHYHPMSIRRSSAQRVPPPSSRQRKIQGVYVLVPRSPYTLGTSESTGACTTADAFHNPPTPTPLRAHNMSSTGSPFAVIKRKHSEGIFDETEQRAPEAKSKRQKLSTVASKGQGATRPTHTVASNATSEFPDGFFYCHQCNKKRDSSGEPILALIMRFVSILKLSSSRSILHL